MTMKIMTFVRSPLHNPRDSTKSRSCSAERKMTKIFFYLILTIIHYENKCFFFLPYLNCPYPRTSNMLTSTTWIDVLTSRTTKRTSPDFPSTSARSRATDFGSLSFSILPSMLRSVGDGGRGGNVGGGGRGERVGVGVKG